jgi:hypothetical protein
MPRTPLDFAAFSRNCLSKFHLGTHEHVLKAYGRSRVYHDSIVRVLHLHLSRSELVNALSCAFVVGDQYARDSYTAGRNLPIATVLQSLGIQFALGHLNPARAVISSNFPTLECRKFVADAETGSIGVGLIVDELFREATSDLESDEAIACGLSGKSADLPGEMALPFSPRPNTVLVSATSDTLTAVKKRESGSQALELCDVFRTGPRRRDGTQHINRIGGPCGYCKMVFRH